MWSYVLIRGRGHIHQKTDCWRHWEKMATCELQKGPWSSDSVFRTAEPYVSAVHTLVQGAHADQCLLEKHRPSRETKQLQTTLVKMTSHRSKWKGAKVKVTGLK